MTNQVENLKIRIALFDPDKHDRKNFSCGNKRIDNYLKLSVKKKDDNNLTRTWVSLLDSSQSIVGFYAVNAHSIKLPDEHISSKLKNALGNRVEFPVVYLSMIGVHEKAQGHGIGRVLLEHSIRNAEDVSKKIGMYGVVLDVLDDGNSFNMSRRKNFYLDFGFRPFPSQPSRMIYPLRP